MIADCDTIPRSGNDPNAMDHYVIFTSTYEVMNEVKETVPSKFGKDAEGWKRKRNKKNP